MVCEACDLLTERLAVKEWHSFREDEWDAEPLTDVVRRVLSERVTRSLPSAWQRVNTEARAREWIEERDREGAALLVVERSSRSPVGLLVLTEEELEGGPLEVRLGYLLVEAAWGKGLATELVRGFTEWCGEAGIDSIVGGVESDNAPSRRVLEKNGFVGVARAAGSSTQFFELRLRPR